MNWTQAFAEIDAFLSDEKIRLDVQRFLQAVGHRIELDGDEVVFPLETQVHVEEKMLVRKPEVRAGGYFLAGTVLRAPSQGKKDSGDHLGWLKIMYDVEGHYIDDFYRPF